MPCTCVMSSSFFFNDTATSEIYTLSYTTLFRSGGGDVGRRLALDRAPHDLRLVLAGRDEGDFATGEHKRSEEHTSELQSRENLVCRLLLEKKKYRRTTATPCHELL